MRLASLTWASDVALLLEAAKETKIDLEAWAVSELNDENVEDCIRSLNASEAILLHPCQQDRLFDHVVEKIDKKIPLISFGLDPALWAISQCLHKGRLYCKRLCGLRRAKEHSQHDPIHRPRGSWVRLQLRSTQESLWQGLYHPNAEEAFTGVEDYLQWYGKKHEHCVGILFFRTYWANGDLAIVDSLIRELEKDVDVLPAFCFGMGDKDLGAKSSGEVVEEYFLGRVDAVVNLQSIFHAGSVDGSVQVLKKLDVPVFHPLTVYHKSEAEWQEDVHGLSSSEVGWSVALPEFEGLIEPILAAVSSREEMSGTEFERHQGVEDRIKKVARRVKRWIHLRANRPPIGKWPLSCITTLAPRLRPPSAQVLIWILLRA